MARPPRGSRRLLRIARCSLPAWPWRAECWPLASRCVSSSPDATWHRPGSSPPPAASRTHGPPFTRRSGGDRTSPRPGRRSASSSSRPGHLEEGVSSLPGAHRSGACEHPTGGTDWHGYADSPDSRWRQRRRSTRSSIWTRRGSTPEAHRAALRLERRRFHGAGLDAGPGPHVRSPRTPGPGHPRPVDPRYEGECGRRRGPERARHGGRATPPPRGPRCGPDRPGGGPPRSSATPEHRPIEPSSGQARWARRSVSSSAGRSARTGAERRRSPLPQRSPTRRP